MGTAGFEPGTHAQLARQSAALAVTPHPLRWPTRQPQRAFVY